MNDLIRISVQILARLPITLLIMVLSLGLGIVLGLGVAAVRIRKKRFSYALATFYVSFIRCTPTLVQLFLVFYGLPQLLLLVGININGWDAVIFAVIAFALHSSAFLSEVIRSAYQSVEPGQFEASSSVGMTGFQALRRIIFPQALAIALPNLGNNLIMILKETSLAFTIGITDIMGQVSILIGNSQGTNIVEVYFVISIFYWVLSIIIERSCGGLEKSLKKGHAGIA